MNTNLKKALIIGGCVLAAVTAALLAVFIIVKLTSRTADSKLSYMPSSSFTETSSGELVAPPEEDEEETANGPQLIISSPASDKLTVTEPEITFTGSSDPAKPLTVNGTAVPRGENGIFTYTAELKVGDNSFVFEHKDVTKTYVITYRYAVIKTYSPSSAQNYPSGSTLVVSVTARKGSTVTASLNGQTITLTASSGSGDFIAYNGKFSLVNTGAKDLNLGKIKYTATHAGVTDTYYSGDIVCKRNSIIVDYDPNATPSGGKYMNVGSGYIAEIVSYNAETFDGNVPVIDDSVDWSRPTNNYLPKGTVDYCSTGYLSYNGKNYATLRAGYRVYTERKDDPRDGTKAVIKQYAGTLPDHNEISVDSINNNGSHTVFTFDCLWKAPFYFDLRDQKYNNPSDQNYTVSEVTFNYIDITFCYATVFNGETLSGEKTIQIPDNPVFQSTATIIPNKAEDGSIMDITVRLFLHKTGAFYGWDSYYNSNGQLCFEFLNPKSVTANAEKPYGVENLNGIKIFIDAGHGGIDSGAPGFDSKNHSEKIQNLVLANKIKAELESLGASVYINRTDNNTISSADDKIQMLKQVKPDYCIAIHHNASTSSSPNGFGSYYFNAFSKNAAEFVKDRTFNTNIYISASLQWHYYFMARTTNCPVVLTENGFISNPDDYENIISDEKNTEKAKAITQGIVDYFLSISQTMSAP